MDRRHCNRKPPPRASSVDSEDCEDEASSLPVLDDNNGDVDGDGDSKEEIEKVESKRGKLHITQSNQRSIPSWSWKTSATTSTRNAANNLKTTGLKKPPPQSPDSNTSMPLFATAVSPDCTSMSESSSISSSSSSSSSPCYKNKTGDSLPSSMTMETSPSTMGKKKKKNNHKNGAALDNGENDGHSDDDDDGYDSWGKGNWCFLLPNKDKYHPSTTATIIGINSNIVRMKISANYEDKTKPTPDLQTSRSNGNNAATNITMEAIDKVIKDDEQDAKVKTRKNDTKPDYGENDDRDNDDDDDDDYGYDSWGKGNWCFLLPNKEKYYPSTTATIIGINSNVVRM
jgi:hypothetical protein